MLANPSHRGKGRSGIHPCLRFSDSPASVSGIVHRTAVINIVGLSRRLIGKNTPHLQEFVDENALCTVQPAFPAVTCTAQATYLTGKLPCEHGAVANGWYDSQLAEHQFWKQSNHLVEGAKLWEVLREQDPGFTCAKLFWWYNMYSSADYSITPRPIYPADGRKVFDIYTAPMNLREQLKSDLGDFPFPAFWGPAAGIASSRWIADSAIWIEKKHRPSLSLVYLPHLDYSFQKIGPETPEADLELRRIDRIFGELLTLYRERSVDVVVLSEYGITPVHRPVHLNRIFRERGWLTIKDELGREMIDLGASRAFAIADHQVAHVYVNDAEIMDEVESLMKSTDGVEEVLSGGRLEDAGINHWRSGDLVAVADAESWFTYYYWMDDRVAPDYARCVDIHRKPGYDPVELFFDPAIRFPRLKLAKRLAAKKLGMRTLMDFIPLDAGLVRGSHGREPENKKDWPILAGAFKDLPENGELPATEVFGQLLRLCSRPSS